MPVGSARGPAEKSPFDRFAEDRNSRRERKDRKEIEICRISLCSLRSMWLPENAGGVVGAEGKSTLFRLYLQLTRALRNLAGSHLRHLRHLWISFVTPGLFPRIST